MCKKLMLLSCLVTLLGLSNIAFAAEFEIFKVDFSCPENPATVKGAPWIDFVFDHGCDGEEHDGRWGLIDAGGTDIDVYAGRPGGKSNLASREGDPISNTTLYFVEGEGDPGCGDMTLGLGDLDPNTTYTVYTYHAWEDGDINQVDPVTVVGADSNLVLNIPGVVDTTLDAILLDSPNVGRIQFTTDGAGSEVYITFNGCVRFNAFELYSEVALSRATSPNPSNAETDVCPNDLQLSWTPGGDTQTTAGHDVYFGTDFNDVTDANRTNHPAGVSFSEGQDSNEYPEDGDGPLQLDLMTTYYWRVDEINDTNTWTGSIWSFTTEDGNARDPDPVAGSAGRNPDANVLSWTPSCVAASQDVYFSTDFDDVNTLHGDALYTTVGAADNNIIPTLAEFTTYYWRIKTTRSGAYGTGASEVWKFSTGLGGLLLEMLFEGTLNNDLPATELDTSGNQLDFTTYSALHDPCCAYGSVKYGDGRKTGTSAVFDPCAGLYRQDTGDSDPLRLAGLQYTIEMWVYLPAGVYPDENAWYMIVGKQDGWNIHIHDPCSNDDIRWYFDGMPDKGLRAEGILEDVSDDWAHVAAVFDMTAQETHKLYIDGLIVDSGRYQSTNSADNNTPVGIGVGVANPPPFSFDHYFEGKIDGLQIWDIALEQVPEFASQPHPPDGSRAWDPNDPNLDTFMWKPGKYAASVDGHNIYFGDSLDDVNESAEPNVTGHDSNSWTHSETFAIGKTYYWRVDEVNDLDVYPGRIWKFQTEVELYDPNIVVYYPLDETSGDDVPDYSGRYFDAECDDIPHWEPDNGRYGGCMHFSMEYDAGDDDWGDAEPGNIETQSDYGAQMADLINKEISICVWVNGDPNQRSESGQDMVVFEFCDEDYDDGIEDEPNSTKIFAIVPTGPSATGDVVFRAGIYPADTMTWTGFEPMAARGTWQHFVFIKNDNDANMYIYLNAELVATKTDCDGTSLANVVGSGDAELKLGAFVGNSSDYHGRLDEFQIYDKQLNEQEIEKIFRGGELEPAWSPSPYDGQGNVSYDTDHLTWKPGAYVQDPCGHQVYFGTNWQDISDVNSSNIDSYPNVEYSHQDACSYDPCGLLELGQTYYWRVDEVNDSCEPYLWKGRIWRFTVAEYITIDDMEDYTEGYSSDYPITRFTAGDYGWDCSYSGNGTGSGLDLVTATNYAWVPARGAQSMAYIYANDAAYYSEISNHFELDPNDWTTAEVEMLTLWFYGDPENVSTGVEQMYVGLEDITGGTSYSEVRYGDGAGEDINDIAIAEWQEWNIALSDFTSVTPTSVETLYIGFGNRNSSQYGGTGLVYFDDIRLYPPRCMPSQRSEEFAKIDFNNDCIVDFGDVEIMGAEWLESDINLGQVTNPSDTNLVGWWKFEEGSGSTASDSSSNGHHGTLEILDVNVWWVAGVNDTNALDFDGGRVRVTDTAALRPLHQVSAAAWIKYAEKQSSGRVVVKGANDKETYGLEIGGDDELVFLVRDGNDPNLDNYPDYAAESDKDAVERDEWVHVAGTYDGNSVKAYVNGELVAENNDANSNVIPFLSQDTNDLAIGSKPEATDDPFKGVIDDVRVYDRGLTAAEVGYLASDGTGIVSEKSIANLIDGETPGKRVVNLRDFAVLADKWLKEEMWP